MPLLSIVTTVYDRADCLASCLRSVANLDWQDYEHIIVADHPPEDAFRNLERAVAEGGDTRTSLWNLPVRTNDFGISPAQFGMQKAQGKYLAFLDDDNAYMPSHFNALIDCLERNEGIGLAYSACLFNAELLLNVSTPVEASIDLGQVLFRRDLFRWHLNDQLNYSGYTWDWQLIKDLLSRRVAFRFIDQETFLFNLERYPHLKPQAPLDNARKRIEELVRALQHVRSEFAEANSRAQDEIVRLRVHVDRRDEQHREGEEQILALRSSAERFEEQHRNGEEQIQALRSTAERLEQQRRVDEDQIVALRLSAERLEHHRIDAEAEIASLRLAKGLLEQQAINGEAEIASLRLAKGRLEHQAINGEAEIAALKLTVGRLEQQRIGCDARISTLTTTASDLESKLDQAHHAIEQLMTSRSWRITAPLRKFFDLLERKGER